MLWVTGLLKSRCFGLRVCLFTSNDLFLHIYFFLHNYFFLHIYFLCVGLVEVCWVTGLEEHKIHFLVFYFSE